MFLFRGKELEDEKTLGECGVSDGSILVHIEATHKPYHRVNYRMISDSLARRRQHQDDNLRMLRQENIFAPDACRCSSHLRIYMQ